MAQRQFKPRLALAAVMVLVLTKPYGCSEDLHARLKLRMERRARAKARRPSLQLDTPAETTPQTSTILSDNPSPADWAPLIVNSTCSAGMSPLWAPCIKDTVNKAAEAAGKTARITYAEELVYPDFQAHIPVFVKAADKAYWLQKVAAEFDRAHIKGEYASYQVCWSFTMPLTYTMRSACSPATSWTCSRNAGQTKGRALTQQLNAAFAVLQGFYLRKHCLVDVTLASKQQLRSNLHCLLDLHGLPYRPTLKSSSTGAGCAGTAWPEPGLQQCCLQWLTGQRPVDGQFLHEP